MSAAAALPILWPESRAAAVACLGRVPIDEAALPALAYLEDPASGVVRQQVLQGGVRDFHSESVTRGLDVGTEPRCHPDESRSGSMMP